MRISGETLFAKYLGLVIDITVASLHACMNLVLFQRLSIPLPCNRDVN